MAIALTFQILSLLLKNKQLLWAIVYWNEVTFTFDKKKKGDQVAKMLGKHQNMPPKNVLLHIPAYMFGYTQVSINNEHTE